MIGFTELFDVAKVQDRVDGREAAKAIATLATDEAERLGPSGIVAFWRELKQRIHKLNERFTCYRCNKWPCECADGISLIHGDSREIVPMLGEVDVVITDPPYAAKTHNGARTVTDLETKLVTFQAVTEDEFMWYFRQLCQMTRRWVVATCDYRHAVKLEESSLPFVRMGVWVKPDSAPQFTGDRPGMGWEAVAVLHREGKKHWNGGGSRAVWIHNCDRGLHPTQKPISLFKQFVEQFSDPGELVLDPFAGSGTTLVACKRLGRRAIGIESNLEYCQRAANRLSQGVLFTQR